jgi:hypothetical protein
MMRLHEATGPSYRSAVMAALMHVKESIRTVIAARATVSEVERVAMRSAMRNRCPKLAITHISDQPQGPL